MPAPLQCVERETEATIHLKEDMAMSLGSLAFLRLIVCILFCLSCSLRQGKVFERPCRSAAASLWFAALASLERVATSGHAAPRVAWGTGAHDQALVRRGNQ